MRVVPESSFDSDIYMIARLAYKDVHSANPILRITLTRYPEHEDELEKLLKNQPANRLKELKKVGSTG